MLLYILKLLSAYYRQQIVLLHYSQYSLWIPVYPLSFKPYMYSAIAICVIRFFLTFSDLIC